MRPGNEAGPSCNGEHDDPGGRARTLALGSLGPPFRRQHTTSLKTFQCLPERLCAAILDDVAARELDELRAEVVSETSAVFYGRETIVFARNDRDAFWFDLGHAADRLSCMTSGTLQIGM